MLDDSRLHNLASSSTLHPGGPECAPDQFDGVTDGLTRDAGSEVVVICCPSPPETHLAAEYMPSTRLP